MSGVWGLGGGQKGRLEHLRRLVTKLIKTERVEWSWHQLDEARGYAEKLIMMAIRNGDQHKPTMEMADYWLLEKELIHKLFKVLVPRYQNLPVAATNLYRLPDNKERRECMQGVLELKGNPWPPVLPQPRDKRLLLTNILLREACQEYNQNRQRSSSNSQIIQTQETGNPSSTSNSNTMGSSVDPINAELPGEGLQNMNAVSPETKVGS
ncbi:hypothetical protein C0Q70_12826 [Pomacea canaliculata]|uniref:Large ribosomal subunit protein bL17m n=2 Tax=Pomacea canaliculata TaxID=400727 RepID=A0A2T7P2L3_POMCA|nr:hypothetical protein C0Q70_12826 [Pomacea canaliculata]